MIFEVTRLILGMPLLERDQHPSEIPGGEVIGPGFPGFVNGGMGHSFFGVELPVPAKLMDYRVGTAMRLAPIDIIIDEETMGAAVAACHGMPGCLFSSPHIGGFGTWILVHCYATR